MTAFFFTKNMKRPIGLFDSGVGGISILDKLKDILPEENFIYLADNKNCPYGGKSKKEILSLSVKNCKKLIEFKCKIIIIACNTATTNSIKKLRKITSLPIVGIEPGIKTAINYTKTNNIGILATEKTLDSKLFFETLTNNKIHDLKIHEQIGYNLVEIIEKGSFSKNELCQILKPYLTPMINKNIDCLVLGCTHYYYIKHIIKEIIPKNITIIDTITPVNKHIYNTLKSNKSLNQGEVKRHINIFYNGDPPSKKYINDTYKVRYLDF